MDFLTALWLPILVAAAAVWVASIILWAVLAPWHGPDMKKAPDPEAFDRAIASLNLPPGHYFEPQAAQGESMNAETLKARYERGPWVALTVRGARPNMGALMAGSFLVALLVCVFIAYVAFLALPRGAAFGEVFRVAGACAVLGFAFGGTTNDLWLGKPPRWFLTNAVDAVVFALITAGVFAWLWPAAV